jgi:hypothetical protein
MLINVLARLVSPVFAWRDRRPSTPAAIHAAQERWLRRLVAGLRGLPVGARFGLDRLDGGPGMVDAFRRLPLTSYEDYTELFARAERGEADVLFRGKAQALAQTSGTTRAESAGERFIPQSQALLDHHRRGAEAALARLLPVCGRQVFDGKLLMMGGSTDLRRNAAGIPVGDLSGIVVGLIPNWLWGLYEPGKDIALEKNWEVKVAKMVERLRGADIRFASGIGSWMLMLAENLCSSTGKQRLCEIWPRLDAVVHGGHAFEPVLSQFRHHLRPDTWLMEVLPASEAFIAVGSRPWRITEDAPPPLEALTDHGIVIEFVPETGGDPDPASAVFADALQAGVVYRIVLTTPGGLVRYQIGDLAVGVGPGLFRFAGRIKTRISVFGEHVEGFQMAAAIAAACTATGASVAHYHVAPVLPAPGETRGAHEWIIEFSVTPADLDAFAGAIDRHLIAEVGDYEAHRQVQLHPPRLTPVPAGTFHRWLAAKGKLGGQHKVPQAWADRTIAEALLAARG